VTGRRTAALIAAVLFTFAVLSSACGGSPARSPSPAATPHTPPPAAPTDSGTPHPTDSEPPPRDLLDLARRYRGLPANAPRIVKHEQFDYRLGDRQEFHVLHLDGPSTVTIGATLRFISERAYFFVEDGVEYLPGALERIGADFDNIVYPTVRAAFGEEWKPGIDGDTRITVLHADLRGAGGYVAASDSYPRSASPRSNEREMIYLDPGLLRAPGVIYNGVIAHELQHLIHQNHDPSEDSWVNEGLSQVAAQMVGAGADWNNRFFVSPDTQLNTWPQLEESLVHYAASELFFSYLLDHYGGRENAWRLVQEPRRGIQGVSAYLDDFGVTFADVFADWAVAVYLNAPEGPFSLRGVRGSVTGVTTIRGPGSASADVHQFGSDYLEIDVGPGSTFSLDGSDSVTVGIPEVDGPFWWSGLGDSMNPRLTRLFDLRSVESATLRFSTWFDIEEGWDYAYVSVSSDGGKTWTALPGRYTREYDPVGAAYGPGYTGPSGGWVREEVSLDDYAGAEVLLRFEYVTDDSTHLRGFAVDDVEIPEIGFFDGADVATNWISEGFRWVDGPLPQRFIVQVIDRASGLVRGLELDADNRGLLTLEGPVTIVVSGATEGTTEKATYEWTVATAQTYKRGPVQTFWRTQAPPNECAQAPTLRAALACAPPARSAIRTRVPVPSDDCRRAVPRLARRS
jgi:hypothetical protein